MKRGPAILLLFVCLQGSGAVPLYLGPPASDAGQKQTRERFDALSREYLRWYFATHPVRASELGIRRHDSALPDLSRRAIARRVRESRAWLARLETIDPRLLDRDAGFDRSILDHAIRAELLDLEEVRSWERNPLTYGRAIADGIATLIDRDVAPLEPRLPDLISRLNATAAVVAAARRNLHDVPWLWAEVAAQGARATSSYLRDEAPALLARQGLAQLDPRTRRRFERARQRAIERLQGFATWIERDLMPRATGDFRLGRELLERKLRYEEHLELPIDELWRINQAAIDDYRARVEREVARIDGERSAAEVMGEIAGEHPAPSELLAAAHAFVEQARRFVAERDLVTLPAEPLPVVRAAPALARSAFASMTTPGPFDSSAGGSFFNLTNVDPAWSARQESEHLTYFNYPGLLGISVHEVMPGHFVQQMWRRRWSSDVRKVFLPASVSEGWAHYVEQMMVDEGLGGDDPAVRLAQLRRALQRHARWQAALSMHAFGGSLEQATRMFRETAYFAEFPARRETQRGTYDPTYLYYALGRMQILALRESYRRLVESEGRVFSLREFHDRFLSLGLPMPLAQEALLGASGSAPFGLGLHAQAVGQPVVVVEERGHLDDVVDRRVVESVPPQLVEILP